MAMEPRRSEEPPRMNGYFSEKLEEIYWMLYRSISAMVDLHIRSNTPIPNLQLYYYDEDLTKIGGLPVNMVFMGIRRQIPRMKFFHEHNLVPLLLKLSQKYFAEGWTFGVKPKGQTCMSVYMKRVHLNKAEWLIQQMRIDYKMPEGIKLEPNRVEPIDERKRKERDDPPPDRPTKLPRETAPAYLPPKIENILPWQPNLYIPRPIVPMDKNLYMALLSIQPQFGSGI